MSFLQSILMGIIQGLTEFLPVSSSGHLVFISSFCKVFCHGAVLINGQQEVFLDIVLHIGSLVAVLYFFHEDLKKIITEFIKALKTKDFSTPEAKLPLLLVVGTILTVMVALPLNDFAEVLVQSPAIVGLFIFITGWILFISDVLSNKIEKTNKMDIKKAVLIGLAQGCAIFPGISRSGSTISVGLLLGLDRVTSARYSFLLSILIIIATSIFYPIVKISPEQLVGFDWSSIIVGFVVSAIVSYFCIKYFLQFLNKHSMRCFAYYCWAMGAFMAIGFHFFF